MLASLPIDMSMLELALNDPKLFFRRIALVAVLPPWRLWFHGFRPTTACNRRFCSDMHFSVLAWVTSYIPLNFDIDFYTHMCIYIYIGFDCWHWNLQYLLDSVYMVMRLHHPQCSRRWSQTSCDEARGESFIATEGLPGGFWLVMVGHTCCKETLVRSFIPHYCWFIHTCSNWGDVRHVYLK